LPAVFVANAAPFADRKARAFESDEWEIGGDRRCRARLPGASPVPAETLLL
jgi:hypothetical protein